MDENAIKTNTAEDPAKRDRSRMPKPAKAILIVLACIVTLLLILVIGINIYMHVCYATFYDRAHSEFEIPGTNSGFIVQDLNYAENEDAWLFSGYGSKGSPSPVYVRDRNGKVAKLEVQGLNGDVYTGHGSGITSNDDFVFLTCEDGYLVFNKGDLVNADGTTPVKAIAQVDLDFTPAFLNIEQGRLYAGNFYFPNDYETPQEHHILTSDSSMNMAILYEYEPDANEEYGFAQTPSRIFSIPEKVQGVTFTPEGNIVLSCSYALATSQLRTYDAAKLVQNGTFRADDSDVPLYILDSKSLIADIEAPPMTEGIEYTNGRIYISNESASNKYIFGKLYGAGVVYSISLADFI